MLNIDIRQPGKLKALRYQLAFNKKPHRRMWAIALSAPYLKEPYGGWIHLQFIIQEEGLGP